MYFGNEDSQNYGLAKRGKGGYNMNCTRPPLAVITGSLLTNLAVWVADFFLVADGKAAGSDLLCVSLIYVRHNFLKGGSVEAV